MKLLVVGKLGYHEDNIIIPILSELKKSIEIVRAGGNVDFFIPANKDKVIQSYKRSFDVSLNNFDAVLFVDYWSMQLPIFSYKRIVENNGVKFFSLYHGSSVLKEDFARNFKGCEHLEKFYDLNYDAVFSPIDIKGRNYLKVPFPVLLQSKRKRPLGISTNKIVFVNRFSEDKGANLFLRFVEKNPYFAKYSVLDDKPMNLQVNGNINWLGRLTQNKMSRLFKSGAYAWFSSKSETFCYSLLDSVSYGATPICFPNDAFYFVPKEFKVSSFNGVKNIISKKIILSNEGWHKIVNSLLGGEKIIANKILERIKCVG